MRNRDNEIQRSERPWVYRGFMPGLAAACQERPTAASQTHVSTLFTRTNYRAVVTAVKASLGLKEIRQSAAWPMFPPAPNGHPRQTAAGALAPWLHTPRL